MLVAANEEGLLRATSTGPIETAQEHLERGGKLFHGYVKSLIDYRLVEEAEKFEQRARDAAANLAEGSGATH